LKFQGCNGSNRKKGVKREFDQWTASARKERGTSGMTHPLKVRAGMVEKGCTFWVNIGGGSGTWDGDWPRTGSTTTFSESDHWKFPTLKIFSGEGKTFPGVGDNSSKSK